MHYTFSRLSQKFRALGVVSVTFFALGGAAQAEQPEGAPASIARRASVTHERTADNSPRRSSAAASVDAACVAASRAVRANPSLRRRVATASQTPIAADEPSDAAIPGQPNDGANHAASAAATR